MSGPCMSNGFKYIRILLIAGVIAIGSANGRVEAGVWDGCSPKV